MQSIVTVDPVDAEAELTRLARRYRAAGGTGVQLLNLAGGQAESLLERLPAPVRGQLTGATEQALRVAMRAAQSSRSAVPDQAAWINTAVAGAMGAAGGLGGLPGALVELPATVTVLLRSIQGVAREHGYDPADPGVAFDCIEVFSAAGPLADDDGADLGYLSVRMALTGPALQKLLAAVAPRLAAVLGQKLAAQTVPVLGALAGAGTNIVYARYYQEIAHVHFGLRRLAIDADRPLDELSEQLRHRVASVT